MAEIRPFRALRFTDAAGRLQELTCPPYDIISESQRLSYLKRNPHNIIRLELPRDGEDPYAAAGDVLREWLREGILQQIFIENYYEFHAYNLVSLHNSYFHANQIEFIKFCQDFLRQWDSDL